MKVEAKKRDDLSFIKRRLSSVRWRFSGFDWPYFEYYLKSVTRQLKRLSPAPEVVVVFNDLVSPEYIKKALPDAKVVVWLQNEWRTRHNMARTAASTDLFVACSDYIRHWTARTHGIPLSRFAVAHNAVDLATFTPREGYLEDRKEVRVLFIGRIDPNKGPDIVADAVALLRAEGLPVTLTLAGGLWFYGHGNEMSDPFFRLLKEKTDAADAELIGHVTRADVPALFRSQDVVCVLSRSQDPYPLVTMEAMASGCAVIASRRGGLPEACVGAGILVEPENFEEVVSTLRSLVVNPKLLRSEKKKSVARASRAPWSKCADVVEELSGGKAEGIGSSDMGNHLCFVNMPIEYYSPVSGGAIATVIMSSGKELIARGHKVSVLTMVNGDETYGTGEVIPIEVRGRKDLSFPQRRLSSIRRYFGGWDWPYFEYYLRSVTDKLRKLSPPPDVVVVYNDLVSPAYIKKAVPGTKVVVWLQNEWRTRFDLKRTVANTDVFLACSEYIRQWTHRTHGIPLGKIVTARSGVDVSTFTPREDYLRETDPLKVLFLGRIDRNKGPDIAADAVATLRAEGLPVSLTVAGGLWFYGHGNEMADPFFRSLKVKMEAAGAEYVGHVTRDRVPELIRRHDVACMLSRSNEPFGLVTMEAMASGCAVIASRRGGLPEACVGAGILVEPDNLQEVTATLRSLVTDRNLLRREKQRSVERAARAPWSQCADVVEHLVLDGAPMATGAFIICRGLLKYSLNGCSNSRLVRAMVLLLAFRSLGLIAYRSATSPGGLFPGPDFVTAQLAAKRLAGHEALYMHEEGPKLLFQSVSSPLVPVLLRPLARMPAEKAFCFWAASNVAMLAGAVLLYYWGTGLKILEDVAPALLALFTAFRVLADGGRTGDREFGRDLAAVRLRDVRMRAIQEMVSVRAAGGDRGADEDVDDRRAFLPADAPEMDRGGGRGGFFRGGDSDPVLDDRVERVFAFYRDHGALFLAAGAGLELGGRNGADVFPG